MKNLTTLSAFALMLCLTTYSTAQTSDNLNISIISPGVSYEKSLNKTQTLFFTAGLNVASPAKWNDDKTLESSYAIYPYIYGDWRNYYNFEKREKKGKKTSENSGNYLAIRALANLPSIKSSSNFNGTTSGVGLGGVWGIQRIYKSKIYLGLSLGMGVYTGNEESVGFSGFGDFHLGFNISSKN